MAQTAMPSVWVRVSKKHPCPVCEKGDWCGVTADGVFACCMRVKTDRPVKNGGWLHRLTGSAPRPVPSHVCACRHIEHPHRAQSTGPRCCAGLPTTQGQPR